MHDSISVRMPARAFFAAFAGALLLSTAGCPDVAEDESGGGGSGAGGSGAGGGEGGSGATLSTGGAGGGTGGGQAQSTHGGLISIQDMSIHGAPQAGHGLTVQASFAPLRAPDYDELPGSPTGCKVFVYDADNPAPQPIDAGLLRIGGVAGGDIACSFQANRTYACPVTTATGAATLTPGQAPTAAFTSEAASFTADDVGRYLRISGASTANTGAFPIVAVPSPTTVVIIHPQAQQEAADLAFTVVAGAGPVPQNPVDPIGPGAMLTVSLDAPSNGPFQFGATAPIVAGGAFTVDDATSSLLTAIPLDGTAVTLGCGGAGGDCGEATLTVVRITTTDGDISGLSPFAFPAPVDTQVDVLCATLDPSGMLVVPAGAMAILKAVDEASAITRIRTAFMREGFSLVSNEAPLPPNETRVLVGHGLLGFTDP